MLWKWIRTWKHEGWQNPSPWLGFAYRDFDRDIAVYYVFPVNLIVALAVWLHRKLWWEIPYKLAGRDSKLFKLYVKAYRRGYDNGRTLTILHALDSDYAAEVEKVMKENE